MVIFSMQFLQCTHFKRNGNAKAKKRKVNLKTTRCAEVGVSISLVYLRETTIARNEQSNFAGSLISMLLLYEGA